MQRRRLSRLQARSVVLLSDTHGPVHEDVICELPPADLIVHLGDIGSRHALNQLAGIAEVVAVRGNNDTCDKWCSSEYPTLRKLPASAEIELSGGTIVAVHGHQWPATATRHQRMRDTWPDAECIVYGHSHRAVIDSHTIPWVVNPGAAGRARAYDGPGWIVISISPRGWQFTEFRIN